MDYSEQIKKVAEDIKSRDIIQFAFGNLLVMLAEDL